MEIQFLEKSSISREIIPVNMFENASSETIIKESWSVSFFL